MRRAAGQGHGSGKDTPNFIANRIGTFGMMRTLSEAVARGLHGRGGRHDLRPATGGRRAPCSAPPTSSDSTRSCTSPSNCYDTLPDDERRDVFAPPPVLQQMVEQEVAGRQDQAGLLQEGQGDEILQLDLEDAGVRAAAEARASTPSARPADVDRRRREDCVACSPATIAPPSWRAGALRDADLLGQPPGRDRRRRRRHRPRAALGLRLGARAVRDLGRAWASRRPRRRWRPPATPSPAGSKSRSPRRARHALLQGRGRRQAGCS